MCEYNFGFDFIQVKDQLVSAMHNALVLKMDLLVVTLMKMSEKLAWIIVMMHQSSVLVNGVTFVWLEGPVHMRDILN